VFKPSKILKELWVTFLKISSLKQEHETTGTAILRGNIHEIIVCIHKLEFTILRIIFIISCRCIDHAYWLRTGTPSFAPSSIVRHSYLFPEKKNKFIFKDSGAMCYSLNTAWSLYPLVSHCTHVFIRGTILPFGFSTSKLNYFLILYRYVLEFEDIH
jgi:hypothetical protein